MTKIVKTYFPPGGNSSAAMKLLLSTILTTLSTALHGLVNPDFIGRLESKDRTFFLGQHGFGYTVEKGKAPRQAQIAKFIKRVIKSNKAIPNLKIPDYIKYWLNFMVSEANGTLHVTSPPTQKKPKSSSVASSPATTPKKALRKTSLPATLPSFPEYVESDDNNESEKEEPMSGHV
jgi:hypothetical protein